MFENHICVYDIWHLVISIFPISNFRMVYTASIIRAAIAFAIVGAVTNEVVKRVDKNSNTKYHYARDQEYDNYRVARDEYENSLRQFQEGEIKRRQVTNNADVVFISNDKLMAKY